VQKHTTNSASNQTDRTASEPPVGPASSDVRPLRVLIVDDGDAMSWVLQQLTDGIADGRYVIARATTLADAFGAIAGGDHDVCVVDHHIGVRTGFDLLSRLADEGLHVPIIFVAEPGDHGTGVTAVGAGASCYIVEDSIGSEHLDQCLRQAVEERRTLSRLTSAGVAVDGGTPTKAQIFSHIAERLSDPATAILDATRTTVGSELPAHAVESLAAIEDHVATILTLAHDLNDLSMLESGRLHFDAAPFSLGGLISGVKRITKSTSSSSDVELIDEVSPSIPDTLIGDPGRLRLLLVRFIDNVARRTSSSRILLTIDVEEREHESVTLRFDVAAMDVPPVDKPSEPEGESVGFRGSLSDSLGYGALGIPVALETVSRMGGHITVGNEPGQPDCIQFTVRLGIGEDEDLSRPVVDVQTRFEDPILVIAGSLDDRRSIVKTLSESGLSYVINSSVEEWIASRRTNGNAATLPSLAVVTATDESFSSCDRFREIAPDVPVIVIASTGRRGDAARCREHGIRGYLPQPVDPGSLVDAIKATTELVKAGDTSTLVTRHWLRDGRRSLRVLVVDDSPTSLFLMTRMLDQRGHSTDSACDGAEAVDAFERDTFDVILMDIMMPGVDGLEATRVIRARDAGSTQRPLIVGVSAFTDQANMDRSRDAGMDALLEKPIRPDDLFALIEQPTPVESAHPA
jgi:two-component system sensor histidine kinase/response regulator